jgi:NADH-quinone oxidoreductase subunit M
MLNENYLLVLILFPFIATLIVACTRGNAVSWVSITLGVIYFIITLLGFSVKELHYSANWYQPLGLTYGLSLDSYSYFLILLSSFLTMLCLYYSKGVIQQKLAGYHALFHALQATVVACLLCDDLVFFYIFWEAMLIPMYFIIGIWGGPRRIYSTMKFFLFTFAGSLFMLIGLIATYVFYFKATGQWTASFHTLIEYFRAHPMPLDLQKWIFLSMILSFAIKVPLFPFHTWLPDAHVEAPTAGSVILAGVLLKMGTYGLMRFAIPLFPEAAASFAGPLCMLSAIGIILGALVAWRQTDIKKLIAYSSVSHLGFVTLGIFMMTETGWNGAYLQMINHGISTGALFLLVGFLYDQRHTREISAYGGIAKILPAYSLVLAIIAFSSVALPGTNGFIGELLIILGSFQSKVASWWWVAIASSAAVLGAIYMLHLVQKVCYGKTQSPENEKLYDMRFREYAIYVPLVALVFVIGFYPEWLLGPIREKTTQIFISIPQILR